MIRGHGRSAADLPPRDALPARPTGAGITIRALLTVLLAGLAVVGALHLYARFA
jgi:hypothetical protein